MKYLCTMFDNVIKREYKLYQVNAREVQKRLHDCYKLSPMMLQLFNSETKLAYNIVNMQNLKRKGYKSSDYRSNEISKTVQDIKENKHITGMKQVGAIFGYEVMPIAICVEGDFENLETKVELIDGFRRMFCVTEVPDVDILIKVYEHFNDKDWINSMIVYNSWKFADGEGADKYMDRGFQLGLYYRYGIRFFKFDLELLYYDMFELLHIYTQGRDLNSYSGNKGESSKIYTTLWNNDKFAEDLHVMHDIFCHAPIFRVEGKRKKTEEYIHPKTPGNIRSAVSRIYEVFVSILGEIRRNEALHKIQDRKSFNMDIFHDYLTDKDMQKHFLKICNMTVDGFILNYIKDHMREDIKERIYRGMDYDYTRPEPKNKNIILEIKDMKM